MWLHVCNSLLQLWPRTRVSTSQALAVPLFQVPLSLSLPSSPSRWFPLSLPHSLSPRRARLLSVLLSRSLLLSRFWPARSLSPSLSLLSLSLSLSLSLPPPPFPLSPSLPLSSLSLTLQHTCHTHPLTRKQDEATTKPKDDQKHDFFSRVQSMPNQPHAAPGAPISAAHAPPGAVKP